MVIGKPREIKGEKNEKNQFCCNNCNDNDNSCIRRYRKKTWTANTLNLKFMANGQQFASNTCTYGQNITIPTGTPTRTGYNFAGWQLAAGPTQPALQQCSATTINSLNANIAIDGSGDASRAADSICKITQPYSFPEEVNCSNEYVVSNGVTNNGDWAAVFNYGTIKGTSLCSSTEGTLTGVNQNTQYFTGNPDQNSNGGHCWCKITDYIQTDGETCDLSSSWVYLRDQGDGCSDFCALNCATETKTTPNLRSTMFNSFQ